MHGTAAVFDARIEHAVPSLHPAPFETMIVLGPQLDRRAAQRSKRRVRATVRDLLTIPSGESLMVPA